ncbi:MAG: hypothetical protein WDM76_19095 [Limisphaerales bacterium]
MQGGEEPGFHFGCVAQLMSLVRPDAKGLLHKVAGIRLVAGEAEGELIKRLVVTTHQIFEIQAFSHSAASQLRVQGRRIVPVNLPGTNLVAGTPIMQVV